MGAGTGRGQPGRAAGKGPRDGCKDEILGIRICHEANACWNDSFEKRIDPQGRPYWWLTGKFVCNDPSESSDEWALAHGYVSIVPIHCDFTHHPTIEKLKPLYC